jgi:hypothetical protein
VDLLKEWAIVCKALDDGRQIFVARKGGVAEEEGEFAIVNREFFLFPGYLHQNREALKPRHHLELEFVAAEEPKDGKIHLKNFARVTDTWQITDFRKLQTLDREHIWETSLLKQRFEWGPWKGLHLLILRAYRLLGEIVLPMKKEYGGCKSWVSVEKEINPPPMTPVLSDVEFAEKRDRIRRLLFTTG